MLLVFGLAALLGIWLTGRLVDRHLRKAVMACLATFAAISLLFGLASSTLLTVLVIPAIYIALREPSPQPSSSK